MRASYGRCDGWMGLRLAGHTDTSTDTVGPEPHCLGQRPPDLGAGGRGLDVPKIRALGGGVEGPASHAARTFPVSRKAARKAFFFNPCAVTFSLIGSSRKWVAEVL